jgi:carbamoyl-phosphate synthase large subunit
MITANVAFTGLDSTENPYPGLSVLRSIKEASEFSGKTLALTYSSLCTGIYQHQYVDQVFLVPYPSESEEYLFARIQEIHTKTPINVLLPCLDSEIVTYARLSARLKEIGIHTYLPSEESVKVRSKAFLAEFCKQHDFFCPQSYVINQPHELEWRAAQLHYPFMLKGNIIDAVDVYTLQEAHVFFHRLAYEWGLPLIMQEYIDGEEYDIAAVANDQSEVIASITMKKIGLTRKGKAFAGVTIEGTHFDKLVRQIVKALNWRGPLEIEVKHNENLNRTYIIEINARFPAWIYTSVGAELNLPLIYLQLALGQEVSPIPTYKTGTMFVRVMKDSFFLFEQLSQLNLKGELDWTQQKSFVNDLLI